MMRGAAVVTLVTLSLLAGRIDAGNETSEDADAAPSGPDDGDTMRLELSACREQIGIFPITHDAVAPYLPDRFVPMPALPPDFWQDPDPTGQSATLVLIGFTCDEPAAALFLPYIPVVAPEGAAAEGAYYPAVALPCIADNATNEALGAWSVPCTAGTIDITETAETPAAAAWTLEAADDTARSALQGGAPASMTPAGPELIRAFHAVARHVCAVVDVRVEVHEHWQFAVGSLAVEGEPSYPVLSQPGLSSLGRPGFGMNLTRMPEVFVGAGADECG